MLFFLFFHPLFLSFFLPEMVPSDVQGELKHLYAAAGELLRHFWSCFPVNTLFLEEKVTSIQSIDVPFDIRHSVLPIILISGFTKQQFPHSSEIACSI